MKSHHQILIIGGGTAGIMTAAQLSNKKKNLDIAIIEPSEKHYYQPAWTLVGAGTFDYNDTIRDEKEFIPRGVKWIKEYAEKIDADNNTVLLKSGDEVSYDYLVVAPGIQINVDGVEGLKETLGKNGVCSNYTDSNYTWKALQEFKGGTAIFTQANTPIKCGGAPQKIMYLVDDYLIKKGIRDKSQVKFVTPGSIIFGVKDFADTLNKVIDRKKIETRFFYELAKIDGPNKTAYFRLMNENATPAKQEFGEIENDGLVEMKFDLLHLAPPQSAPDFVKNSPIAHQEGAGKG
ncbi:MAG: NAD(P)/FAD-dependent oxidoreductase, partial [Cyclobacteriaceae bacterium]|nr:NAD(P)/FAD-dependent oxidoreductase [Cyclobacteriaceae bacterium]